MSGGAFLILYLVLLLVALVASFVGVRAARPDGRVLDRPDADALAWLGGGKLRLLDTLAARGLANGSLDMVAGRFVAPDGTPLKWRQVTAGFGPAADEAERRLKREGQLIADDALPGVKRWANWPFGVLALIGIARLLYGLSIGEEVGFLVGLLFLTFIVWMARRGGLDRRTTGGKETLARARRAHDRLRRAPTPSEMDMGVALFGTTVLAGSAYAGFHDMRTRNGDGGSDSSSSSDSSSDSGGDGGCGGGGCGGCGGGGD